MRKFIVRNFALYYRFNFLGRTWTALRASRILAPFFLFMAFVIGLDPQWPLFQWWDYVLFGIWAVLCWIGFGGYKIGYFDLWPIKREELDTEQQEFYDYYKANIEK